MVHVELDLLDQGRRIAPPLEAVHQDESGRPRPLGKAIVQPIVKAGDFVVRERPADAGRENLWIALGEDVVRHGT